MQEGFCCVAAVKDTHRCLQEKGAQHKALEEALKDYGYNVTTLPIVIGQSGSQ